MTTTLPYNNRDARSFITAFSGMDVEDPVEVEGKPLHTASTHRYRLAKEAKDPFAEHFNTLKQIRLRSELWIDPSEPPSPASLDWANAILETLQELGTVPSRVVTAVEGGVAVCFIKGDKYADIECLSNGLILGVTSNRHDQPTVWKIERRYQSMLEASDRIKVFMSNPTDANVPARAAGR
jgi:hypothetical protein